MTWRTALSARNDNRPHLKLTSLVLTTLGVALVAAACTVTSDDGGPSGGNPSGGNSSGGMGGDSSTGGSDATGGMGGDTSTGGNQSAAIDCHPDGDVSGTLETAEPDESDACTHCGWEKCSEAYGKCFATSPDSACGGHAGDDGELACMFQCFSVRYDDETFLGDAEDIEECAAKCGAHPSCDGDAPSSVTQELAFCMIDYEGDNCLAECELL